MNAAFFNRLAEQCRERIKGARTPGLRAQLEVWIEEFEAQAQALAGSEGDWQRTVETRPGGAFRLP